jgi:membrane-associated protease RseP (regulator of RpoE activity)
MLTTVLSAAHGPAAISRTKRTLHMSLCAIPTIFMLLVGLLTVYNMPVIVSAPRVRSVSAGEAGDRAGIEADDVIVAVDGEPMMFMSQLRNAIAAHPDQPITLSILRAGQPLMIRATPARSANEGRLGIGIGNETADRSVSMTLQYLWLQTIAGLVMAGSLGLYSALTVRGGIALRLMHIAVVTRNGTLASGSRARLRAVLSWSPVLAASAAAFAGHAPLLTLTPQATPFFVISPIGLPVFFSNEPAIFFIRMAVITVSLGVFALGVIAAVVNPERGLQDSLAGTWLVPR